MSLHVSTFLSGSDYRRVLIRVYIVYKEKSHYNEATRIIYIISMFLTREMKTPKLFFIL